MKTFEVYILGTIGSVPLMMYLTLIVMFIIGSVIILYSQKANKAQKISRLVLVEWLVLVICSTVFFREPRLRHAINIIPFWSYFGLNEANSLYESTAINILNICMFIPVGFLLSSGFRNITCKQVLLTGLVLSSTIELLQFIFCKGLCEVDDVIHNVIGCLLGFAIYLLALKFYNQEYNTIPFWRC